MRLILQNRCKLFSNFRVRVKIDETKIEIRHEKNCGNSLRAFDVDPQQFIYIIKRNKRAS